MARDHKTIVHENAARILESLLERRTEFEQKGIEESSLATAVGLSADEALEAIDYLESREDLARLPEALSNPPRFLLKPARGWREIVAKSSRETTAGG